jgi:hypothetical protein
MGRDEIGTKRYLENVSQESTVSIFIWNLANIQEPDCCRAMYSDQFTITWTIM